MLFTWLGLTVGCIRAIFKLPKIYGEYPEPLTYVEWFTPLGTIDSDLNMYIIGPSSKNHQCCASIVPISRIERSCHLILKLGKGPIDPTWHLNNILNQNLKFYVNCYLRHIDFIFYHSIQ